MSKVLSQAVCNTILKVEKAVYALVSDDVLPRDRVWVVGGLARAHGTGMTQEQQEIPIVGGGSFKQRLSPLGG